MSAFFNSVARTVAEKVLAGENPLVAFDLTYAMHSELNALGAFHGWLKVRRCAVTQLRYRVLHTSARGSKPFVTQNTWVYGDLVPRMEELTCDETSQ